MKVSFSLALLPLTAAILITLLPIPTRAACTGASPIWSSTPDRSSVESCVAAAQPGDRIDVLAGSATWSSTLNITQGVLLIGAGVGTTVISKASSVSVLINYTPSASAIPHNYPFRVSGFTFELGGSGKGMKFNCGCATTAQTKLRIDHNRFHDSYGAIEQSGCRGVIDHNAFDSFSYPLRIGWGDSCGGPGFGLFTWDQWGDLQYGEPDQTMYVEDNTFTGVSTCLEDADQGGSYVIRYNTVHATNQMYPLLDLHGGRGDLWGARGAEVYGNQINGGGFILSHRGGKAAVFFNNLTGGGVVNIYNNTGCPPPAPITTTS